MSYESLADGGFATGTMLGSGGFIVMDDSTSIVTTLRCFMVRPMVAKPLADWVGLYSPRRHSGRRSSQQKRYS